MAQQTVFKRTAAAAAANTDTSIFVPGAGVKTKILFFYVVNEGAAGAAGMSFELRFGSNIVAGVGLDSAAAPIGQTSKEPVISHEIIGDGSTPIYIRNLVVLAAGQIAAYTLGYDANY